jgi:quercetin dioxygenase-like cupin family protein
LDFLSKEISKLDYENSSHLEVFKKVIFSSSELISLATQVAYTELKVGVEVGEHAHETMEEFFLVLEGSCEFSLDGQRYVLNKETAIRVPPKIRHKIKAITHCRLFYFGVAI